MNLAQQIEHELQQTFVPQFISVENESHLHHSGKGTDSHFKVTLVSESFIEQPLLARHRSIQKTLKALTQEVHALGLYPYTPQEWLARGQAIPNSPKCAG